ncbi:MAG: hypothetical protein IKU17_07445 [Clostridia bacterium]|nr:hypothetical protein [Clostridia bacterium]
MEINYNASTKMLSGFPVIRHLGATGTCGESSPFIWHGRAMRLELMDESKGTDPYAPTRALIRDRETGEVLSSFGEGCYYYSLYQENGTVYVLGTVSRLPQLCGDTIRLFESTDLKTWKSRDLLCNPGWQYFNTSLTKGPDGYVLLMEANRPIELVGVSFTLFFATSPDLVHWTHMSPEKAFSKERYNGGPWMRYSRGWYYVISVTELPCQRYTNYIFRTKDFDTWEVGFYNPLLSPTEEDRKISPKAFGFTQEQLEEIKTGFLASSSDMDLCDWPEENKVLISYNLGNQLGFYYMAEAEVDGSLDDFLEANFR